MELPPSCSNRGMIWQWTCGTSWPASIPLLNAIVVAFAPTASSIGRVKVWTVCIKEVANERGS